jgi:hypothetical protein
MCGRERTAASKQNVDAFNLQLQNLRYEVLHLRKEVSRCINFRSADENIRLVPVEEFYREADPDISQPDTTQGDVSLMEIISSVSDSHHFERMRIRILLVTLKRIRDPDPQPDPSFQIKAQNFEEVLEYARFPYILACHLQIDADPDPACHFEADPNLTFHFDAYLGISKCVYFDQPIRYLIKKCE